MTTPGGHLGLGFLYANTSPLLPVSWHQIHLLINLHHLGKVSNDLVFHLIILFAGIPLAILQRKKVAFSLKSEPLRIANIILYFFTILQKSPILNSVIS